MAAGGVERRVAVRRKKRMHRQKRQWRWQDVAFYGVAFVVVASVGLWVVRTMSEPPKTGIMSVRR